MSGVGHIHAGAWRTRLKFAAAIFIVIFTVRLITRLEPSATSLLAFIAVGVLGVALEVYAAITAARLALRFAPIISRRRFRSTGLAVAAFLAASIGVEEHAPLQ